MIKINNDNFEINKTYKLNKYHAIIIFDNIDIKIDFVCYNNLSNKVIFLNPDHSFCFTKTSKKKIVYEIPLEKSDYLQEYDVLFRHIESMAYIDIIDKHCMDFYEIEVPKKTVKEFLDYCVEKWHLKNPFKVSSKENKLLFEFKRYLDEEFLERFDFATIKEAFGEDDFILLNSILKKKLSKTVKKKLLDKLLTEARRKLMYSHQTVNQISDDLNFNNSAYFVNFFKSKENVTPKGFRDLNNFNKDAELISRLTLLIQENHILERKTSFYADKLFMTTKNLNLVVKRNKNVTISLLIKLCLVNTSKEMLEKHKSVTDVAYMLKFKEVSHFSSFFKKYANISPTAYIKSLPSTKLFSNKP